MVVGVTRRPSSLTRRMICKGTLLLAALLFFVALKHSRRSPTKPVLQSLVVALVLSRLDVAHSQTEKDEFKILTIVRRYRSTIC